MQLHLVVEMSVDSSVSTLNLHAFNFEVNSFLWHLPMTFFTIAVHLFLFICKLLAILLSGKHSRSTVVSSSMAKNGMLRSATKPLSLISASLTATSRGDNTG
uniref:Uncharacterized protein n=1 Tax=Cacopsylla melanoneura TaxID=428564 RepID=A0A8D8PRR3_9HEMI